MPIVHMKCHRRNISFGAFKKDFVTIKSSFSRITLFGFSFFSSFFFTCQSFNLVSMVLIVSNYSFSCFTCKYLTQFGFQFEFSSRERFLQLILCNFSESYTKKRNGLSIAVAVTNIAVSKP